ncbi:MAG: SusC/RagA family TonB-linked outer membrane protein [Candidatus Azobacteroides sp.]|nr:SusC/RagA family TonB-linked outer membrane protein [Candidatus Azobacteroides sp.]
MKITFFLLFFSVGMSFADSSYAQKTSLSLKMNGATVAKILDEIENQTEFRFYYNSKLVDTEKETSIDVNDADVFATLDKLFAKSNVSYRVIDKDIILTVKQPEIKNAAEKTIAGTVTDENGEPLVGVNATVKGNAQGTITDLDGRYSLSNVPENSVLVFSYIGMQKEEITVDKNNSVINVIMRNATFNLDEVVALGYTTQKRRDVIGSVAKISTDISTPAYSNITAALQGKASGVYVSQDKIRIRGMNSISLSTEPLWIIDGVPGDGSDLNPNDIESVSILKDASATALYGSSGANGIIAITTKSFAGQKSHLDVEVDGGFSGFIGTGWKTMNTADFISLYDQAIANAMRYEGKPPFLFNPSDAYSWNPVIPNTYLMTRDEALTKSHNGIDDYTQSGQYIQAYMNANKGFDKGNASFSLTYRGNTDVLIGSGAKKLLGRVAFNVSPVKYVSFNFSSINSFRAGSDNTAGSTLTRPPFMPIWDPGSATGYWAPGENPIIRGDSKYRQIRNKDFTSTNYLRADIDLPFVKGLKISGVGSANFSANRYTNWSAKELMDFNRNGSDEISRADDNAKFDYSYMVRGEIAYNRTFGDHTVGALGLVEGKKYFNLPVNATGYNLNGNYPMLGTPANMQSMSANRVEGGSIAYIGRLTYNYKDKYLIEGNIRKDGLSTLSEKNRWATFPSLGLGWILSEESFWNKSVFNLIKIRGSIGKSGNAAVPAFSYLPQFGINYPSGASYDEYMFTNIKNIAADIKWETSDNSDIGIDFGLFGNRINGSIAYYNKETSGLLLQVPLPPSAGLKIDAVGDVTNSVWANVGNMRNNGIEFTMDATVIRTSDFTWNLSYNHTVVKNKILALDPSVDLTGSGIYGTFNNSTLTKAGGELATYYVSDFAGIDPEKGIPMIWERDKDIYAETGATVRTGEKIPASRSNCNNNQFYLDGKSYIPSFFGGLRSTFRYKNLDLNLLFSYTGGHYYFDQIEWRLQYVHIGENALAADLIENSWKQPGDNAKYQELIYNGGFYYDNDGNPTTALNPGPGNDYPNTTQFLKKGDNFQWKELTLGYTFPKRLTSKCGMDNLRLNFNVSNVLYWAAGGHNGNPDVQINDNNVDGVIRYESFMTRTFSLGFSVKF